MLDVNSTIQNLRDAGCGGDLIERYIKLTEQGQIEEQLCLLSKHRVLLLDKLHEKQKMIDCLDHLLYRIKKIT